MKRGNRRWGVDKSRGCIGIPGIGDDGPVVLVRYGMVARGQMGKGRREKEEKMLAARRWQGTMGRGYVSGSEEASPAALHRTAAHCTCMHSSGFTFSGLLGET